MKSWYVELAAAQERFEKKPTVVSLPSAKKCYKLTSEKQQLRMAMSYIFG